MGKLSNVGRIFYGIAMVEVGFQTIYYKDVPYMLLPLNHTSIPGFAAIACVLGALFILAGACIVFGIKARQVSLLLGGLLLLIFCFYFLPYQLFVSKDHMHFSDWENSAKELSLAGGALAVAGCFLGKDENPLTRFLGKLIPLGIILYAITIISFSIDHFLYAHEAADYVPAWAPNHVLMLYITGAALFCSGIAIILKIWTRLAATLLGAMIFIWFASLHIPRVVVTPIADMSGEAVSAFIALAYSGTAFVIAGTVKKRV